MESKKDMITSIEIKIKLLEIENQKLLSTIEANNKQIQEYKSLIQSFSNNNSSTPDEPIKYLGNNPEDKIINLKFGWIINDNARMSNDLNRIRKVAGGSNKWNCSAIGNKSLIKGKINKWKLQLTKLIDNIFFGIVPKGIDLNAIENWRKGYVTCSCNFAKHNLGVWTEFAKRKTEEGNILEIIVDLEMGELSFSVNGNNLGIFCNNIIKDIEYVPFLDISSEGTEITLL